MAQTALPSPNDVWRPFRHLSVDFVHPGNVATLAVRLFDCLRSVHGLGDADRELLWCAGLLHDVGYELGWQSHHKSSMKVILDTDTPMFAPARKRLIACVARYHRGAAPKDSHPVYSGLTRDDRARVRKLAAILRVADGLDRGQIGRVRDVGVRRSGPGRMTVLVYAPSCPHLEIETGLHKSGLFADVYGIELDFEYAGPAQATA